MRERTVRCSRLRRRTGRRLFLVVEPVGQCPQPGALFPGKNFRPLFQRTGYLGTQPVRVRRCDVKGKYLFHGETSCLYVQDCSLCQLAAASSGVGTRDSRAVKSWPNSGRARRVSQWVRTSGVSGRSSAKKRTA